MLVGRPYFAPLYLLPTHLSVPALGLELDAEVKDQ